MPTITDIKPQKKPGRSNIFLNGKYAFSLTVETLFKSGLKINQDISEEKIKELIKDDDYVRVYDYVLKYLSLRPRSVKEIKDWFRRKSVGEETQKYVLEKLKNLDYLNDKNFTKWWIEQRDQFRPSGSRMLTMELRQKGIPDEIIRDSLREREAGSFKESGGELALAKKVIEKKTKVFAHLPPLERKQKLTQVLLRRGFSWDLVREILHDQLVDEENKME